MVFRPPVIDLTQQIRAQPTVAQIRASKPKLIQVLSSPKLTAVLAGTLSALTGAGALTAAKVALGTGFVGGLAESPTVRRAIGTKVLAPEKGGRFVGDVIEDPSKLVPKGGLVAGAKDIAKKGGIAAGVAALGVGGVIAGTKAVKAVKERFTSRTITQPPPIAPAAIAVSPIPTTAPAPLEPFGAVKQPEEVVPVAVAPQKPVKITNNFNPSIDIRFKKSKKFINQQVLVKQ